MKTADLLLCCSFVVLVLSSVASTQDLNTTEDLRNTSFGMQFPRHGLMLLLWFADNIGIDQNNVIQPLYFRPDQGVYGFHYYANYEYDRRTGRHLFPNSYSTVYYSFGNVNSQRAQFELPVYVTQDYLNSGENLLSNIDRIVIRVERENPQRVQEVYITQHYEDRNRGSGYDPDNTYRVSTQLLRQVQNLIRQNVYVPELVNLYPRARGLIPLLTQAGYDYNNRIAQYTQSRFCIRRGTNLFRSMCSLTAELECETPSKMKLEVKSTSDGYAKILWSEVPEELVRMNSKAGLYKDNQLLKVYDLDRRTFGTTDTKTVLNSGLQVKLLTTNNEVIWVGREFDEANGALPTEIKGFDASLQLFTKDGYACARLFIRKTFSDWKTRFHNSWVGFYRSSQDSNNGYKTFQWSVYFKINASQVLSNDYDIYEYESNVAVGPGVQVRFLLDKSSTNERARTIPWVA